MHSPGLVATKTSWSALISLPCQGSLVIARAKQAASTLGRQHLCELLWNFAVEGKLFELWKSKMTEAVMPLHELGLFIGG